MASGPNGLRDLVIFTQPDCRLSGAMLAREQKTHQRDMRRLDREIDYKSYKLKHEMQRETPDDEKVTALRREIVDLEHQLADLQRRHEQSLKER